MQRYDLRDLHDNFYSRMGELIDSSLKVGEVGIFLFEVGDYSSIQKSADYIRELGHNLMNSLKFNEVDWTIVVKKVDKETITKRKEEVKAKEETKIKVDAETKIEEKNKKATTAKEKGK